MRRLKMLEIYLHYSGTFCLAIKTKFFFYRVHGSFEREIFRSDKTTKSRQYFVYYRDFL